MSINELDSAAKFLNRGDARDPEIAATAAELNQLLGRSAGGGLGPDDVSAWAPPAEQQAQARDEKGRFVPHAALHEERSRRKQIEAEKAALEAKHAEAAGQLAELRRLVELAAAGQGDPQQQTGHDQQRQSRSNDFVDPENDVFEAVKQMQQHIMQQRQAH
jgi:hypothetical protein